MFIFHTAFWSGKKKKKIQNFISKPKNIEIKDTLMYRKQ